MARAVLVFLCLWGAIAVGIMQVRHMTGQEIWSLTKLTTYSMVCALLALIAMVGFVILF